MACQTMLAWMKFSITGTQNSPDTSMEYYLRLMVLKSTAFVVIKDFNKKCMIPLCSDSTLRYKEYVASLIGLYKNNGAVSCVAIKFLLILHHKTHKYLGFTQIASWMRFTHGQLWIESATRSSITMKNLEALRPNNKQKLVPVDCYVWSACGSSSGWARAV